jgi:hypothetical protein
LLVRDQSIKGTQTMLRALTFVSLLTFLGTGALVSGCNKPLEKTPPKAPTVLEPAGQASEHRAHDSGSMASEMKPVALSAEDRELIAKQKVCPVSGQVLGSMGDPVKVVVKGRTVFLCCPGCKAAIEKDPDKYLAKLDTAGQK